MKRFGLSILTLAVMLISTVPFAYANPPQPLYGVKTAYSPGAITTNAQVTTTVSVVGAQIGDMCLASYSVTLAAVHITCAVNAADVATVYLINITGGTLTPTASSTVKVTVFPTFH